MAKIKTWFYNEYVKDWKLFDYIFLFGLLAVQLAMTPFMIDSGLSIGWNIFTLVASFIGTLATIICAKGKMSYYIWGFIQTIMFLIFNFQLKLWVETAEQMYYLITMIIGVFVWKNNINTDKEAIKAKKFTIHKFVVTVLSLIILSVIIYFVDVKIGGTAPLLDTLSLSIAIVANILCTFCYKEQWILWFVLDVVQTILYFVIGQPIMAVMYIAWTINTVYGWYNWGKLNKAQADHPTEKGDR
jgi:nicotinamide mononucleotide transporter